MLFLSEREKGFEMGLFDYKNSIIMDKCDKAYKGEKVMVLTSKHDEYFKYKSEVSVFILAPKESDYYDNRFMATDEVMSFIFDHIYDDKTIKKYLGNAGVELAKQIRNDEIIRLRSLINIPSIIVVSHIKIGKHTRLVIWNYKTKEILDVVRLRKGKGKTETLQSFIIRLKERLDNSLGEISIYTISEIKEIKSKFFEAGFVNIYNSNMLKTSVINKIESFEHNLYKTIKNDKRIISCQELDVCFPFL